MSYDNCNDLEEDGVEFGFQENGGNRLSKIEESKEYEKLEDGDDCYLYKNFTLISKGDEAYQDLFHEMREWLKKLPESLVEGNLEAIFRSTLTKKAGIQNLPDSGIDIH